MEAAPAMEEVAPAAEEAAPAEATPAAEEGAAIAAPLSPRSALRRVAPASEVVAGVACVAQQHRAVGAMLFVRQFADLAACLRRRQRWDVDEVRRHQRLGWLPRVFAWGAAPLDQVLPAAVAHARKTDSGDVVRRRWRRWWQCTRPRRCRWRCRCGSRLMRRRRIGALTHSRRRLRRCRANRQHRGVGLRVRRFRSLGERCEVAFHVAARGCRRSSEPTDLSAQHIHHLVFFEDDRERAAPGDESVNTPRSF